MKNRDYSVTAFQAKTRKSMTYGDLVIIISQHMCDSSFDSFKCGDNCRAV